MLFHSYALSPVVTPRHTKLMLERSTSSKMFVGIPPTSFMKMLRWNIPMTGEIYQKAKVFM